MKKHKRAGRIKMDRIRFIDWHSEGATASILTGRFGSKCDLDIRRTQRKVQLHYS
jgi:hypothetical protein